MGNGKIAIAGAGITGAYLYRLLSDAGQSVDIFDRPQRTSCGIAPCAWGTSSAFFGLVARAGLDGTRYILKSFDTLTIDDVRVRVGLFAFDKPRLIKDLLQGAPVRFEEVPLERYDRIIDATGVSRALLPPIEGDTTLSCHQTLLETDEPLVGRVKLAGIGYAWCFPLGGRRYHVGCGSLLENPRSVLESIGWLGKGKAGCERRVVCACSGNIRVTAPHFSLPLAVRESGREIWGIGEAIGCVAPLIGDGIVPGMRSVELLLDHFDDAERYQRAVLEEFRWMKDERGVMEALRSGSGVGIREARIMLRNSRRMDLEIGFREVVTLLRGLVANYLAGRVCTDNGGGR